MFAKHANNWFLFAKKIPKPHKQLIINGFLFAKKIPCNKLLVTLFCFYFFRFRDAAFLPDAESFLTLHPNVPRVFPNVRYSP